MQHLDEGTIHAWLDGELGTLEVEQAAKHVGECATCAAAVAEARGIIAGSARIVSALDDVPGGVLPGAGPTTGRTGGSSAWRRLRLTPGRAALAATILLAVSTTLTLRSPSSPALKSDSSLQTRAVVSQPKMAVPTVAPAPAPVARSATMDSTKSPRSSVVDAGPRRKANVAYAPPQTQALAERREVADAAAPADTMARAMAKARVTAQQSVIGGSAGAQPVAPAPAAGMARGTVSAANAIGQRVDSLSTFEGCYHVSADSSSGSTEMPRGLPASFTLTRPSQEVRVAAARRAFSVSTDSIATTVAWRQLSTTQANVTFAAVGTGARSVSLMLTAGSPVGLASSGDQTTKVRVVRASCPR